ncbi:MAG TPA: LysE family translocator [Streptosporangiaceae bacterium]|nr:LysE family translocator [Streptosporangiaceae bacterium]
MPSTSQLLTFALFSFLLIILPGPNVMFVISRSLVLGRAAGVGTALGGQLGIYAQVAAVALGIGALVERYVAVFTVLKLAGAAYVIYLGVQALRHRKELWASLGAAVEAKSVLRIVRDGFLVGVSNPKSIVFFVAVLPQFVDRSAGHVPVQIVLLGTLFMAIAVLCDCSWAFLAGTARNWFARSPRRLELIGGTGGLAMIGLGATLALTGRKD